MLKQRFSKCLILTIIISIVILSYLEFREYRTFEVKSNLRMNYIVIGTGNRTLKYKKLYRNSFTLNGSMISEFNVNIDQEMSGNALERLRESYYVYSSKCKMPKPNPFTHEAMEIFQMPEVVACTKQPDVVTVHYESELHRYRLRVHEEVLLNITRFLPNDKFGCYYSAVSAGDSPHTDEYSIIGPKVYFLQDEMLPPTIDNILVSCHLNNRNFTIQNDAFALVQVDKMTLIPIAKTHKPSVIMLGLDSLSRVNLRRTMPKTLDYLNRQGWFELQGYNKIDDNTFPNLLAVLTGLTANGANNVCDTNVLGCYNMLTFIWDFFKRSGYKTAYAEDFAIASTFNYMRKGFTSAPVDYYLRPFFVAAEKALTDNFNYCVGRRSSFDTIFSYCFDFITRFIHDTPTFGLFWSSTVTHQHAFAAATIDDKFVTYLKKYEELGLYEKAIVIFFSDHGQRFGALAQLPEGFLEERLPTLFISLPAWFKAKYPAFADALRDNRNRLTTTFDLYMTLKHIIELSQPGLKLPVAENCLTAQSLLQPVPYERNCSQACIPSHWCTCEPYTTVTKDPYMMYVARMIVHKINSYLFENHLGRMCRRLSIFRLLKAERKLVINELGEISKPGGIITYRIKFELSDDVGKLQATVVVNKYKNKLENFDVESISRLDAYSDYSKCIEHKIAKKFCFCL